MGTDVDNTSRFNYGAVKLALTYGGDYSAMGEETTIRSRAATSSRRAASAPWAAHSCKAASRFFDKVDLITALRYDTYNLSGTVITGGGTQTSKQRRKGLAQSHAGYTPVKGITVVRNLRRRATVRPR